MFGTTKKLRARAQQLNREFEEMEAELSEAEANKKLDEIEEIYAEISKLENAYVNSQ